VQRYHGNEVIIEGKSSESEGETSSEEGIVANEYGAAGTYKMGEVVQLRNQ
jgi:hypothetical protein